MILPYSTLNVVAPTNWSSHKRTVHVPGNHALPPGFSNEAAWELGYSKSDIDPALGKRRHFSTNEPRSGGRPVTDLTSPYSQNEASVKLMSLLQRGNQLRRIRIPVGGWPSGIMFGMGMRPTDVTETVPPGGAARNTSMAMAMNAAFTAIHAEAVAKAKAAEEVQAKGVEHESEMLDDNVEEMEQEQDEEEEVLRVKLEGHKNTRQDAGAGSALPSLETANTNNLSASTSSRVPSKLEPIHPGSSKTVTFETPAVCQKHPPRPPTSMARLEPINIPSPPELQQPLRPVTPSSYASPLPPHHTPQHHSHLT